MLNTAVFCFCDAMLNLVINERTDLFMYRATISNIILLFAVKIAQLVGADFADLWWDRVFYREHISQI